MKKILILICLVYLTIGLNADDEGVIWILDNGVKKQQVIVDSNLTTKAKQAIDLDTKIDGFILGFSQEIDIDVLEVKYQIKKTYTFRSGLIQFENRSNTSDILLLQKLIDEEPFITTAKPNKKMKMQTF
jgi:hypothetical protein